MKRKNNLVLIFYILLVSCSDLNFEFHLNKIDLEKWNAQTTDALKEECKVDTIFEYKYIPPFKNLSNNKVFASFKDDLLDKLDRRKVLINVVKDSNIVFNTHKLDVLEVHLQEKSYFYILDSENQEYLSFEYDIRKNVITDFKYQLKKRKNYEKGFKDLYDSIVWYFEKANRTFVLEHWIGTLEITSAFIVEDNKASSSIGSILLYAK